MKFDSSRVPCFAAKALYSKLHSSLSWTTQDGGLASVYTGTRSGSGPTNGEEGESCYTTCAHQMDSYSSCGGYMGILLHGEDSIPAVVGRCNGWWYLEDGFCFYRVLCWEVSPCKREYRPCGPVVSGSRGVFRQAVASYIGLTCMNWTEIEQVVQGVQCHPLPQAISDH